MKMCDRCIPYCTEETDRKLPLGTSYWVGPVGRPIAARSMYGILDGIVLLVYSIPT